MIIAIDTGGTKTLITTFDKDGNPGEQKIKFPTPQAQDEYINQVKTALRNNFSDQNIDAIVVATPGVIKDGVVLWAGGNLNWENFNIVGDLSGTLDNVPVFAENDAKLAGLYEAKIIDPIPGQLLYVTISTGIGTAIITEGHIDPELRNSEGGDAMIEFEGQMQKWESFSSGKAFYNTYGKYVEDIDDEPTLKDIAHRMSLGFLELVPTLQPNIVVIGGSVGTHFDKYIGHLIQIMKDTLPRQIPCPPFIQAKNPEQAVIYGCYYYALDNNITIKA